MEWLSRNQSQQLLVNHSMDSGRKRAATNDAAEPPQGKRAKSSHDGSSISNLALLAEAAVASADRAKAVAKAAKEKACTKAAEAETAVLKAAMAETALAKAEKAEAAAKAAKAADALAKAAAAKAAKAEATKEKAAKKAKVEAEVAKKAEAEAHTAAALAKQETANATKAWAQEARQHGMTLEKARELGYKDSMRRLKERQCSDCMKKIVQCIVTSTNQGLTDEVYHERGIEPLPKSFCTRNFLSSYIIASFPESVFESIGASEEAVLHSARLLLACFDGLVSEIASGTTLLDGCGDSKTNFPFLLADYLDKFKKWKYPDLARLVRKIKNALEEVYSTEDVLRSGDARHLLLLKEKRGLRDNLRCRLAEVAGLNVLREIDQSLGMNYYHPIQDNTTATDNIDLSGAAFKMSNPQMAHEILIEGNLQFDENGYAPNHDPVLKNDRMLGQKIIWRNIVYDMDLDTPCYSKVYDILERLRDKISKMAKELHKDVDEIHNVIDMEAILKFVEDGAFTRDTSRTLLCNIMDVLQDMQKAERRVESERIRLEICECFESSKLSLAFCSGLEKIESLVQSSQIDILNDRVRLIRPRIVEEGVEYLQRDFEKKLGDKTFASNLPNTRRWFEINVERMTLSHPNLLHKLLSCDPSSFKILHDKVVHSLVAAPIVKPDKWPETLFLDMNRLWTLRCRFFRGFYAAVIMLEIREFLSRKQGDFNAHYENVEKALVKCEVKIFKDCSDQVLQSIASEISSMPLTESEKRSLEQDLKTKLQHSSNVFRVMYPRMAQLWCPSIYSPGITAQELFQKAKIPFCLANVLEDSVAGAVMLRKVCILNRKVHVIRYNTLIPEVSMRVHVKRNALTPVS